MSSSTTSTTHEIFHKVNPLLSEIPKKHPCLFHEPHKTTFSQFYHLHGLYKPQHRPKGEEIYYQIFLGNKNESAEKTEPKMEERKEENSPEEDSSAPTANSSSPTSLKSLKDYPYLSQLRGIVVFVHGYADHSSRSIPFMNLPSFCNDRHFAYVCMDHEGHGLTHGTRGLVRSIKNMARDIGCFLRNHLEKDFADALKAQGNGSEETDSKPLPIILIGQSMGGLISCELLRMDPQLFKCAVLSAPLIVPSPESAPPRFVQRLVKHVVNIAGLAHLPLIKGNKGKVYTNSEHDKDFVNDPLTYSGNMRLGTGVAMLDSMESFSDEDFKTIASSLPCLVQQGDKDRSCCVSGAHHLGECGFKKIIYPGNDHELFREECHEQMMDDIHAFVDEVLSEE